ncbi:hypothetical protein ACB098_01G253800 [Castanea mollissima]|uniref:Uncharacterized protein n=1 Tax=Castanea mollissima TaxID=60419 RepID=A0A8J4QV46_9ROSI|nr:hypothetical protein CMV_018380 [Castanea mollissima]
MLLAAFCDKLKSSIQQNLIQLLAVHKTHILSIEAGFWKLQVECEDPKNFRALTIDRDDLSEFGLLLDDVKDSLSRLLVVSLIPISKSVKHASPVLAKHAQATEGPLLWIEDCPPCL